MTIEERITRIEEQLASLRSAPADMQTLRIEAAIMQVRTELSGDLTEIAHHVAAIEANQTTNATELAQLKRDVGDSFERVLSSLAELRQQRQSAFHWPWGRTP